MSQHREYTIKENDHKTVIQGNHENMTFFFMSSILNTFRHIC